MTFTDPRLTTVAFRKTDDAPGSSVDAGHESLAGAVFAVSATDPTAAEVGRCTTATDGTCTLPGTTLVEGTDYTWAEVVAPPGFALDTSSHPFTASCDHTCVPAVESLADAGRYAAVTLVKHAADDPAVVVPGAVVDLCAGTGLPSGLGYDAPTGSSCDAGETWVASATTGSDGRADFGLLPPGTHYCAVERVAPKGWQRSTDPVCGDLTPAATLDDPPPAALQLQMKERRIPAVAVAASRPSAAVRTTTPERTPPAAPSPTVSASPVGRATPVTPAGVAPTAPSSAPPTVLAYTGARHVQALTLGGLALVGAGAAALVGAAAMGRRRSAWGGWTPDL